jgi:glutaryl-CoA dehydrogenase
LTGDFYEVDALLGDEARAVGEQVRRFVDREAMPLLRECFRAGRFPRELVPRMAELGLLGASIHGYGCAGLSPLAYGVAMRELERGDSGLRSFASVQGSLAMHAIASCGSEEQRTRWLPRMARGEAIGCFALTEAEAGSDPGALRTRARRDGPDWVLEGAKLWITSGSIADLAVVWARTGDGPESIRGFLVERGTPGFTASDIAGRFALRASVTSELRFDGVRLPADALLAESRGLVSALRCLNEARYTIAWGATGAMEACYQSALEYTRSRRQFGRPIASFQLVQAKLVDMLADGVKAQLVALRLGQLKEAGRADHVKVSFAKRENVAAALRVARTARELLGANGITDEYPPIRHALNLEAVYTYEGTHEMHTLAVGREVTGLDALKG